MVFIAFGYILNVLLLCFPVGVKLQ